MIKLLTFYSDTHLELYENYFLKSYNKFLTNEFNLKTKHIPQISSTGEYGKEGFEETMIEKIKFIIENINLNDPLPLVFADCDVNFLNSFKTDIVKELQNFDIKFQLNHPSGELCAGFFIAKQNSKVLQFFEAVLTNLTDSLVDNTLPPGLSDQNIINYFYKNLSSEDINIGSLCPKKYYTVIHSIKDRWTNQEFTPPSEMLVHHANWVVGIDKKIELMEYIQNKLK